MYEGKLNTERDVLEAKSQLQKAQDQLQRASAVSTVYNVKPEISTVLLLLSADILFRRISIKICS
jgi:cobalt-zinc-cadmium efflux system membrane fusion protein